MAPLTPEIVVAMRRERKQGMTIKAIAELCGVSQSTAASALHGRTWKSVDALEAPVAKGTIKAAAGETAPVGARAAQRAVAARRLELEREKALAAGGWRFALWRTRNRRLLGSAEHRRRHCQD